MPVRDYELIMVAKPSADDDAVNALVERAQKFVTDNGGSISKDERWGLRRLAYSIQGFREGVFILTHLEMDGKWAAEMEAMFKLQDDLLRHLLVKREVKKKAAAVEQ